VQAAVQQQATSVDTNPYERTHAPQTTVQAEEWKKYHSAWQDYYKRYYEGYYTQQVASAKRNLEISQASSVPVKPTEAIGSQTDDTIEPEQHEGPVTRKQAMQDLKEKLRTQVETSAKKARKSRHFVPVIATLAVLLIFGFLQYNQVLIANVKAYITPGSIDPQNIIVDPASTVAVGPEPRLIIPKINVDAPVFYDIGIDKTSQDTAMENGVAHFAIPGANSHPGEIGNTVLSGHSSNDVFAAGDYKFIFMQLDKLQVGDTVYANYQGTRYTYVVTKKEEVGPNDVQALIYETDKPVMTLITCTPLGTALRRLLVTAEQVYPVTTKPAPSAPSDSESTETTIPGQGAPTFFERLFRRS
jgi:sortase A